MLKLEQLIKSAGAGNAKFAYAAIFLLQLKVIWGVWQFRDLTAGDTSSYFVSAFGWYQNWSNTVCWSPLYTAFYGTFLSLSQDAYLATTAHRVVIVLALALLVLAVMRRLLPPTLAWLVAAWWVVLPINFNSAYEVHLFAVLPALAAYLAILSGHGRLARGVAFGVLLLAGLLMRNELLLATAFLAALMVIREMRQARKGASVPWRECMLAYGIPVALTGFLTLFFYAHSHPKFPELSAVIKRKHSLNVCQIFAVGYQQRHSDWRKSAWTECQDLMTRTFGAPEPSMADGVRRNPRAMLGHFLWNAELIPSGLQVLLFNSMSGSVNPDYFPVRPHSRQALALSCLLAAVLGAGGWRLYRNRSYWWKDWLLERVWGWVAMGCVACTTMIVMLTQRPRPSYMFTFGLMLMAAAGMCVHALVERSLLRQRLATTFPFFVLLLIAFVPSFYDHGSRPLLEAYRRLAPFRELLGTPEAVLVTPGYGGELCNYLTPASLQVCQGLYYFDLRDLAQTTGRSLPKILDEHQASFLYVNEVVLSDKLAGPLLARPEYFGWKVIGLEDTPQRKWVLLQKIASKTARGEKLGAAAVGSRAIDASPWIRPC